MVRMRKDVGLLLIDCPVICCDALNQDDCTTVDLQLEVQNC